LVVEQVDFDSDHAAILLVATLVHDIGMLSQRPEDMPKPDDQLGGFSQKDVPSWVRQTHIPRLRNLLERILEETEFRDHINHTIISRAIKVAQAHGKWPWSGTNFYLLKETPVLPRW